MKKLFLTLLLLPAMQSFAQNFSTELNKNWKFSRAGTNKWYPAVVPGTVYTDLLQNKLIPDPFYSDNEKKVQWVDTCDWIYTTTFEINLSAQASSVIEFEGLDTYADVYLNDKLILVSNNMFSEKKVMLPKEYLRKENELSIYFHSALKITDSIAKAKLPIVLPDNNRVYARKAQFQFGWDWGPKLINCGVWKKIVFKDYVSDTTSFLSVNPVATLIREKDSIGESFYFVKNGKPVYIKGANWIPANIFLPNAARGANIVLVRKASAANINMLRVWGGGVYEDDAFYDLCDRFGIMVWQDFMFAGGMYPTDDAFLKNVKEEVRYQVNRLKRHPCIVLWCGNNEIDEAWHNWGWQDQFNIHGADSAKLWNGYKTLFEDSLRAWVNEFDGRRSYIPSSPKFGWGNEKSFTQGDSHYWGLWWGLEPWEALETHTGRFVSEYGMQSMPNYKTVKTYVPANDLNYSSPAVQWHQKANDGFSKLNFYLDKYFIDSVKLKTLSLEEYTYLTQCLQYYILKNSIAVQRSKEPRNMGTLLWQLNDCWPATSWSIMDFNQEPKAGWYAVKEAYRDDINLRKDSIYPKYEMLKKPVFTLHNIGDSQFTIESNVVAKYVYIFPGTPEEGFSNNYFDLAPGEKKIISVNGRYLRGNLNGLFKFISLYDILNKP